MAKKQKPQAAKDIQFSRDPFNSLKGFAASELEKQAQIDAEAIAPVAPVPVEVYGSFADEMAILGVERIDPSDSDFDESLSASEPVAPPVSPSVKPQTDEDEFLQALGQLDVRFSEQFPDEAQPPAASARRMKQLKQGKLTPQASLDLHGLQRTEVAEKLQFFLENSQHQGWSTLLVITGKGLHSEGGEPVLRNEAERFLAGAGRKSVAEWGRAPKQYGGDGALVLFLRKPG